jgi:hypothetical protein
MSKKNYDEEDAVNSLKKKYDIRIAGKKIQHLKDGKGDVGIGSRGKIDFLTKYKFYTHVWVSEFKLYH